MHTSQLKHLLYIIFTVTMLLLFSSACVPTQNQRTAQRLIPGTNQLKQPTTYYCGYSKTFQPYKECLITGRLDDVLKKMSDEEKLLRATCNNDDEFARRLGLLGLLERSSLSLQAGDVEKSLYYCKLAEGVIEERESESYVNEGLAGLGSMLAEVAGAGEYGRYDAVGFEKVMLLNLKAINYLLQGDDRAFNVARLAIQWQDEEKDIFDSRMEEIEKENTSKKGAEGETGQDKASVYAALDREFSKYNAQALKVPNAFVNPFGDYLAGTVNEFKSVKIKSLLSNAHISYKQALKLNPDSRVLKLAAKDTKKKRSAARLIQIIAFDGFAPEKKVLSFEVAVPGLSTPLDIEVPTYEPIPSRVVKIKVTTTGGKVLANLSPVADVETLALRHQKDMLPAVQTMIVSSTLRDALIKEVGNAYLSGLGTLVGSVIDSGMEPDTSSWMSLPSKILAGRFHPSKGLKKVKIISYDSKGKKLSQQTVTLSKGSRHLIFIRTIDETLTAFPSKPIWSPKRQI